MCHAGFMSIDCCESSSSAKCLRYQWRPSQVKCSNYKSGVMVSVLASSAVDRGFIIGLVFAASPLTTALRSKSKDWLARNQENVSEWKDMSNHGLFFQ